MMHKSMVGRVGPASVKPIPRANKPDVTLKDYIERKQVGEKKKLTFEEWLRQSSFLEPDAGTFIWLQDCWKAAQENV